MKIYTRGGDEGETSLLGPGRVRKDDPRIEAYGTVDELSSAIGLARLGTAAPLDEELAQVQSDLFTIGAFLAAPDGARESVAATRIAELEAAIDRMEDQLAPLRSFILPGGSSAAAHIHLARTVCRRAERRVARLEATTDAARTTLAYLNRLSDYLFVAARWSNRQAGVEDVPWEG
ncbi:MAG TPA: cob(I)yrinic acid a,c-diamide adenosyltransferase [Thermoanaerobaculia bacterium]|nr:cob(I)yrinic acid a,c-diamide adenosyltransferase [Thermoanaerobaculia bacterium]